MLNGLRNLVKEKQFKIQNQKKILKKKLKKKRLNQKKEKVEVVQILMNLELDNGL